MKIIGIAGKAGAGKDTIGVTLSHLLYSNRISSGQPHRVTKLSFANKLKEVCCVMFGWDRERLEQDYQYKEGNTLDDGSMDPACQMLGMTRRQIIQTLGTEGLRNGLNQDIWIICLKLAIMHGEYDKYAYGFITDCRFLNELQFVRDMGGSLIRVDRVGEVGTLTNHVNHASETEWLKWDDWDYVVKNEVRLDMTEHENFVRLRDSLVPIAADIMERENG